MRPTRTVLPALLVAALLTGCGGGDPAPNSPTDKGSGKAGKTDKSGNPPAAVVTKAEAEAFASGLLVAVREKKATPDQLTPEFKKVFAPPALEAEKVQGHSDAVAATELGLLAADVGTDDVTAVANADGSAFAVGKNKAAGSRTLVRVVKVGTFLKADWLSVGPKGVADATLSGDAAGSQFAAQSLIDAVLRKKHAHAEALLTEAARNRYGESVFDKKFDRGALKNKLDEFFGGYERYAVAGTSGGAVTVDLPFAAGKKTATLTTVRGTRPGEWLVDGIEVK